MLLIFVVVNNLYRHPKRGRTNTTASQKLMSQTHAQKYPVLTADGTFMGLLNLRCYHLAQTIRSRDFFVIDYVSRT